jgi:3-oxoacyl-[acyl-carrier-protein] synthase II
VDAARFAPTPDQLERVATLVGVGLGGMGYIEETSGVLAEKGPRRVSPYFIPSVIGNLAAGQITMRFGFRGPSYSTVSACASGAHSVGEAFHGIRFGIYDAAIAGGAEATITGLSFAGFTQMRALSKRNEDPTRASRPYDTGRDGFVMSEGAAIVLLEEREAALARGAPVLAEVVGYGATSDAFHITQPAPEAEGARRAMELALKEAGIQPAQIDYINGHGTSTETGDKAEIQAIRRLFGAHATGGLAVSSTKSMTGHLLGAAGAIETALTALSLHHQVLPPTANLERCLDEAEGMDLVPHEGRRARVDLALNNSFGFGGQNACLVLRRHAADARN